MKFTLEFDMDNAAFDDSREDEVARILAFVTDQVRHESDTDQRGIYDVNGNRIGTWTVSGEVAS